MKIGILSRNPTLYSTRRLARAAWTRGHQVQILDTTSLAVHVGTNGDNPPEAKLLKPGSLGLPRAIQLPQLEAIIPRIGTSVTFYGLAVVRQFEAAGMVTTASSQAIALSRDKLHSLQLMAQAGLPVPRTAIIARPEALYAAVHAVGGLPVVVKVIRGTQGRGVVLAHQLGTVNALVRQAGNRNQHVLIQEYVAEASGRDIRAIVVGDVCVAAMERRAASGDFRANLHVGGTATGVALDAETTALAVRAARAHGLAVAGVDLLLSDRGPLLLEVNSSPGLEGIEQVTGYDVAGSIIAYVERAVIGGR
jgi:ribosomal protein S6--L-glutamate ligase